MNLRSSNRYGYEDARKQATATRNQQPQPVVSTDAPARPSHHAEDHSPGTGGEGQDRGGWRRGEEAQETPQEL